MNLTKVPCNCSDLVRNRRPVAAVFQVGHDFSRRERWRFLWDDRVLGALRASACLTDATVRELEKVFRVELEVADEDAHGVVRCNPNGVKAARVGFRPRRRWYGAPRRIGDRERTDVATARLGGRCVTPTVGLHPRLSDVAAGRLGEHEGLHPQVALAGDRLCRPALIQRTPLQRRTI